MKYGKERRELILEVKDLAHFEHIVGKVFEIFFPKKKETPTE